MKITLFVAALAITTIDNQVVAVGLNTHPRSSSAVPIPTSETTTSLAQQKALSNFKWWESPDVAGLAMALIGGIFQGFGLADQFMAGREHKDDILTAVKEESNETAKHLV